MRSTDDLKAFLCSDIELALITTYSSSHYANVFKGVRVTIKSEDYELTRTKAVETWNLHVNLDQHIRNRSDFIITPRYALRVIQVLGLGKQSAKSGKNVEVNI